MRRVLITGAGKRLGRILAVAVAKRGDFVIVHYHASGRDAAATVKAITEAGGKAVALGADLTQAHLAGLVEDAGTAAGGPICALVNNASVFDYDDPADVQQKVFSAAMATNFDAPARLSAAMMKAADPANDNVVINLLDQKLWNLNPDFASYTASKAALATWTRMLDIQLGQKGRACALAPGLLFPSFDQSEEEFQAVASHNLRQTPISPKDVAMALTYILKARLFRGQVLHVDNGQRYVPSPRDIMFSTRP